MSDAKAIGAAAMYGRVGISGSGDAAVARGVCLTAAVVIRMSTDLGWPLASLQ